MAWVRGLRDGGVGESDDVERIDHNRLVIEEFEVGGR